MDNWVNIRGFLQHYQILPIHINSNFCQSTHYKTLNCSRKSSGFDCFPKHQNTNLNTVWHLFWFTCLMLASTSSSNLLQALTIICVAALMSHLPGMLDSLSDIPTRGQARESQRFEWLSKKSPLRSYGFGTDLTSRGTLQVPDSKRIALNFILPCSAVSFFSRCCKSGADSWHVRPVFSPVENPTQCHKRQYLVWRKRFGWHH